MIGLSVSGAFARSPAPPQNARPLSTILQTVEHEPQFQYIDEVNWTHGVYEIECYTTSGREMTICIDPVTGERVR